MRTIVITGALLTLLSWAGLFFQLIIMVSYRFLARSRLERRLLDSELAKNESLDSDVIREQAAAIAGDRLEPG